MTENKSIKDKSINDVTANTKRVAREVKETTVDAFEDVKDVASDTLDDVQEKADSLTVNQKVLLGGGLALVASVLVQTLVTHFRKAKVIVLVDPTIEVDAEDIMTENKSIKD